MYLASSIMQYSINLVIKIADKALTREIVLCKNRSIMPTGHNGPYHQIESPLRNSAHWAFCFSKLYRITGDQRYREIAVRLCNYLLEPEFEHKNGVYILRQKGNDSCNGVIGPAWIIEALNACIGIDIQQEAASSRQLQILEQLEYSNNIGAWHRNDAYKAS